MTVHAYKAQEIRPTRPVPDLHIDATEPLPDDMKPIQYAQAFATDAQAIVDALWESLPGATLDIILTRMLYRRASTLHVPMPLPYEDVTR